MENIYIQQWDAEKFFNSRKEWTDLLNRSDADPLFLSWEWQSSWWQFFSEKNNMQLRLYAVYADDDMLIGIAPLFSTSVTIKNIIKTTRLQFIGNCWRGKSTMPTELLSFIADKAVSKAVIRTICSHIDSLDDWDEFIIPYLDMKSQTYRLIFDETLFVSSYLRSAENYRSYFLSTIGSFDDYTQKLGRNTRLKLLNRRKNLHQLGAVKFRRMLADDIDDKFKLLNQLHDRRWSRPAFEHERLAFNKAISNLMAQKKCLNFSIISLDDTPISIQYNYVINHHNYNIQAGFDESLHKKISPGYLHFGYEIEASFEQNYLVYDFLAGEGKNTQYKERLTDDYLQMIDLQIIRRPLLKFIYRLYDSAGQILLGSGKSYNG
ncbi:MAG: GNAT family N-acetyltransferase [Gammaproteobacteria bacterium]|nr:GNAT family N-acetyltransferase [Gammaproteobacteria bacterium]